MFKEKIKSLLERLKPYKPAGIHLGIMLGVSVLITILFFFAYLPMTTYHGQAITVPDVTDQPVTSLDQLLKSRQLRYEIGLDSGYNADKPPLVVLEQTPRANTLVKRNRKIYLTLNAKRPPMVRMPDLVDMSLKVAHLTLNSFDLKMGRTEYQPDLCLNCVLEMRVGGKMILPGTPVPKGTVVNLVLGNGNGNEEFPMPNLIGLDLEDAQIAIIGSGLKVGNIHYEKSGKAVIETEDAMGNVVSEIVDVLPGQVFRHQPYKNKTVKLQSTVDLWVFRRDNVLPENSLLDQ
jgi:eukaryotic-like serine/threonine-protein kinase